MSIDNKTKELLYRTQNNQKISIYMAILHPFGLTVFGFLLMLYFNEVFDSYVPVMILGGAIMMYFFRTFVDVKKHDYQNMFIFRNLISLRNRIRGTKDGN